MIKVWWNRDREPKKSDPVPSRVVRIWWDKPKSHLLLKTCGSTMVCIRQGHVKVSNQSRFDFKHASNFKHLMSDFGKTPAFPIISSMGIARTPHCNAHWISADSGHDSVLWCPSSLKTTSPPGSYVSVPHGIMRFPFYPMDGRQPMIKDLDHLSMQQWKHCCRTSRRWSPSCLNTSPGIWQNTFGMPSKGGKS